MYEFIRIQWVLGKYDAEKIAKCVTKNYITQTQADEIMKMEQTKQ